MKCYTKQGIKGEGMTIREEKELTRTFTSVDHELKIINDEDIFVGFICSVIRKWCLRKRKNHMNVVNTIKANFDELEANK